MGESPDGRHVLLAMEQIACDVLLLDLSLPKVSGIEVLRRLRQSHPDLRIVVLSMYAEEQYALRLLREGAAGYVSKDRPAGYVSKDRPAEELKFDDVRRGKQAQA